MNEVHVTKIAAELNLMHKQVRATALLFDEGATIPFIARYRKEVTGSLDEVAIGAIRDRLSKLIELDKRREAILKALEERGQLTDELKGKIAEAESPYSPGRYLPPVSSQTPYKGDYCKEKGLEPLAQCIFAQDDRDPASDAAAFVNAEKGVDSVEDALRGAGHYCRMGKRRSNCPHANARTVSSTRSL